MSKPLLPSDRRWNSQSGVALVLVLAILVLIVGLAVALLNLSTSERKSASIFLASAGVQTLADKAVAIVQAQINSATTRGSTVAWSSQPGMVRTYTTSGNLDTAYKLYSAATMTQTDASKLSEDVPTTDWTNSPALWTDLNAPVTVTVPSTTGGSTSNTTQSVYPIIDPSVLDLASPQQPPLGFAINGAPGSTTNPRAPMPVRWLYILQDGQIVAPTGTGSTITVAGATSANPIKGRIAFWTDDESCKVNINTAGEGSFWNTPHFYTTEDRKFATSQPISGEFQRYPGHPAMTSLSAVFPGLTNPVLPSSTDQQILGSTNHTMSMTPRYQWGGSQQGSVDTFTMTAALNGGTVASGPLYADANEISFLPNHTIQGSNTSQRDANTNLTHDVEQKTSFFLTADSRAPEVNLFNLPRIACWPIPAATTARSVFDPVIAFGSTIGGYPYYFQRQSALDGTVDAGITRNQQIFQYLQSLTGQTIPGFGVKLSDKFGTDRDQILTEIWDYIRCTNLYDSRLTAGQQFTASTNTPGYGYVVPLQNGSTQGFGRSITLAELSFVFICTADPKDSQSGSGHPYSDGLLHSNSATSNLTLGGTALQPSERRVQMMLVPEFFSPSQGDVSILPKNLRITVSGLDGLQLGGKALFPSASGSVRISDIQFNTGWSRRFLGGLIDYRALLGGTTDGGHLDAAATSAYPFISNFVTVPVTSPGSTASPGTMSLTAGTLTVKIETSTDNMTWTTAQTIPIKLTPTSTNIPIPNLVPSGTTAEVGGSGAQTTIPQNWWAFSKNIPYTGAAGGGRLATVGLNSGFFKVTNNVAVNSFHFSGTLFRESENTTSYTDIVRSVAPSHGDLRLVNGLGTVPDSTFTEIGDWTSTGAANALIHTLSVGVQNPIAVPAGSQYRRHYVATGLVGGDATMGASGYAAPDFRTDTTNAVLSAVASSGDFDNGTSFWPDGPYINKPDEGNVYGSGTAVPYFDNSEQEKIVTAGFFSPNRLMPGPGMFGSLPTHLQRYTADPSHPEKYAWRTLLFRKQSNHPDDAAMSVSGLPGNGLAPDHLLMDLYWMPTVEPYAISEPFSTAGKINMNYQLQPFPYIQRQTGMYAVLQREKLLVVPTTDLSKYKTSSIPSTPAAGAATVSAYSQSLDVAETLKQFDARFADPSGRIFLSPTELCDLWLVPSGSQIGSMPTFWTDKGLTGDNMREKPYTNIIPRLTTKSNTFTVHYRVQGLKAPKNISPGTWDERQGTIAGEYRGSTTIQRFINLNDPSLATTDFAATGSASTATLDSFIRWRVLNARQFAP